MSDERQDEHRDERWFANARDRVWSCPAVPADVLAFHRTLAGYSPTRLVELPAVAAELGVGRVFAKDESSRLGLPAFKALGASWAIHRALEERALAERALAERALAAPGPIGPVTFVTATDGNHGRAVARMARLLGHKARITVPDGVHPAAIAAIEAEGAPVTHVAGSYDDAVAAAARDAAADPAAILLQDTAWPGYETVPAWIVEGYATLFAELDEQLAVAGIEAPSLVVVPVGVGSLAQAAVAHYRSQPNPARTALLSAEPVTAACALASLRAGCAVSVPTQTTIMAGLNCGTPSSLAWPYLHRGLDGAAAVTDAEAAVAGTALRAGSVDAGPCGWAGLAAAKHALAQPGARGHLGVGPASTLVLVVTEGSAANPAGG